MWGWWVKVVYRPASFFKKPKWKRIWCTKHFRVKTRRKNIRQKIVKCGSKIKMSFFQKYFFLPEVAKMSPRKCRLMITFCRWPKTFVWRRRKMISEVDVVANKRRCCFAILSSNCFLDTFYFFTSSTSFQFVVHEISFLVVSFFCLGHILTNILARILNN